ncbi:MAG: (2Fe-2S)-binding protein [Bacteroidota bacterium]
MTLNINNQQYAAEFDSEMPLLWVLRDILGLTGTKYGCGIGQCGACTILIDGKPIRSCSTPASFASGKRLQTIEGLEETKYRVLQEAWIKEQVPQCGYCQSGQLMSATALLMTNANPSEAEILDAMRGNICRCGTYPRILKAIASVVKENAV